MSQGASTAAHTVLFFFFFFFRKTSFEQAKWKTFAVLEL